MFLVLWHHGLFAVNKGGGVIGVTSFILQLMKSFIHTEAVFPPSKLCFLGLSFWFILSHTSTASHTNQNGQFKLVWVYFSQIGYNTLALFVTNP